MDANLLLWIGQIVLALALLVAGYGHALGFDQASARPRMEWMTAVGRDRMRVIGILEVLGAVGLIVPAATGILPWLTPVAASCLAIVMLLAAIYHWPRPGERGNVLINLILGVIAALIAYGRFVIAPL